MSTTPAVVAGVVVVLWLTATTVNLESFMGAIMAIGVAVANAILLVTFAEHHRREEGTSAGVAAVAGAQGRLRPILMTSCAMTAGMIPLALGWSEGSEQTAPLARAVIGGLAAATLATLVVLPTVFAIVQSTAGRRSASIDPADPESERYDPVLWPGPRIALSPTNGVTTGSVRIRRSKYQNLPSLQSLRQSLPSRPSSPAVTKVPRPGPAKPLARPPLVSQSSGPSRDGPPVNRAARADRGLRGDHDLRQGLGLCREMERGYRRQGRQGSGPRRD